MPAWAQDITVRVVDNGVVKTQKWGDVYKPDDTVRGGGFTSLKFAPKTAPGEVPKDQQKAKQGKVQQEPTATEKPNETDNADIEVVAREKVQDQADKDEETNPEESTDSTKEQSEATVPPQPVGKSLQQPAALKEIMDGAAATYGSTRPSTNADSVTNAIVKLTESLSSCAPNVNLQARTHQFHRNMHNLVSPLEKDLALPFTSILAGFQKGVHVVDLSTMIDQARVLETPAWEPWAHPSKHFNDSGVAGRESTTKAVAVEIARFRRSRLNAEEDNRRILLQIGVEKRAGPVKPAGSSVIGF